MLRVQEKPDYCQIAASPKQFHPHIWQ